MSKPFTSKFTGSHALIFLTIAGRSFLNREEVTLAEYFKKGGYSTSMFGKWHLGDNFPCRPHDRGFDTAIYHGGGGVGQTPDLWGNDYFDDHYFVNGTAKQFKGYCTDVWFDEAIKVMSEKRSEPLARMLTGSLPTLMSCQPWSTSAISQRSKGQNCMVVV